MHDGCHRTAKTCHNSSITKDILSEFIQASMGKIQGLSRTSQSISNSFQGLKIMKNTDLSVKIRLQKC